MNTFIKLPWDIGNFSDVIFSCCCKKFPSSPLKRRVFHWIKKKSSSEIIKAQFKRRALVVLNSIVLSWMQRDCSTTVDWNVVHVALNSCWLLSNRLYENTASGDWGQVSCKMADMDSSIDQRRKVFLLRRILAKKERMSTQRALLSCHEEKWKRIFGIHFQIKCLRNFYEYWEVLFSLFLGISDMIC